MWFYYRFLNDDCESPVDDIMTIMSILYYVGIPLTIITCILIFCYKRELSYIMLFLLPNTILSIVMIITTQIKYNESWENNTCYNLKSLTKGWLIWNYIHIGLEGIFYILGIFGIIYSNYLFEKEKDSFENYINEINAKDFY